MSCYLGGCGVHRSRVVFPSANLHGHDRTGAKRASRLHIGQPQSRSSGRCVLALQASSSWHLLAADIYQNRMPMPPPHAAHNRPTTLQTTNTCLNNNRPNSILAPVRLRPGGVVTLSTELALRITKARLLRIRADWVILPSLPGCGSDSRSTARVFYTDNRTAVPPRPLQHRSSPLSAGRAAHRRSREPDP